MATETVQFTLGENNPQRLTDWAKEPVVATLRGDLEAAKPSQQMNIQRIEHWNRLRDAKPKPDKNNGVRATTRARSKVQPKLIRRQAEWRYSALSEPFHSAPDMYNINPATANDTTAARQNGVVLNWQWRTKLNRIKFIDDYVRSNVDDGTVIVRVGWKRATVKVQAPAPVWSYYPVSDPNDLQALQQAIQESTANPDQFKSAPPELQEAVNYYHEHGQAVQAKQTGTQMVETDKVIENRPTAEVLNPANFFPDPSCNGDFDKALFAIVSFETNLAELKKEGKRYKNLELVNWEGNTVLSTPDHETTTPNDYQFKDRARKKVVAYEYWGFFDIKGDDVLVPIVATWIGDVMIRMELNPFPDQKLPFVVVPYLPIKREMMGEPDAELLEDNQAILGALTRGMIDLLGKSANGQQGMAKGMLDPLNKKRFDSGQDYEFNPSITPANGLITHKYPELPQSAMQMTQMMNQDAEALTGVKSFSGGVSGSAYGDVAAGIKGVLDAAGKRESAILRRLAKGMVDIGIKFCSMNEEFLSDTETVAITKDTFVTVNRDDLIGDYNLEVDIATAEVDNTKAQDMAFMLQTIGPNAPPGVAMMIMANIADLKRMPDLAHQLRTFQPQPDPLDQEKKQLEIALIQAQIAELQGKTQMHAANAKRASSQADLQDLDFVQQETGTTHARELELQNNKASNDKHTLITKALTQPGKEGQTAAPVQQALGFNVATDKLQDNLTVPPAGGGSGAPQPTMQ